MYVSALFDIMPSKRKTHEIFYTMIVELSSCTSFLCNRVCVSSSTIGRLSRCCPVASAFPWYLTVSEAWRDLRALFSCRGQFFLPEEF